MNLLGSLSNLNAANTMYRTPSQEVGERRKFVDSLLDLDTTESEYGLS
jgi:hypothetical protein